MYVGTECGECFEAVATQRLSVQPCKAKGKPMQPRINEAIDEEGIEEDLAAAC
jgi:hypothetical protein